MQYVTFLWDFCQITSNHQSNTKNNIQKYDFFLNMKFIKFHGIPWNFIKFPWNSMELFGGKLKVPWNSMEFHGTREYGKSSMEFHRTLDLDKIPWNSMELGVRQFRWHEQFHGTWSAPISVTRAVPWNSMELQVRQFRWHEQFHGFPWNFKCANFTDTSSSMEFHGILWTLKCANFADTSSSMEFHRTWGAPISMTRAVP